MLRKLWLLMKWLIIILVILVVLAYLFLRFAPTFGGKPDAKTQEKISASKHFNGEIFN